MRGMSSFQAGSSSTARIRRAALASALSISHHQKSLSSVLNFSVVPRVGQAAAQDLLRLVQALVAFGNAVDALAGC